MKFKNKDILVLGCTVAFLFLSISSVIAQEPSSFHFKHIGLKDGLSQASVTSVIQDNKGFLWFGTVGGLNRFDGREMVVYRSDMIDNNSLSNKHVTDICKGSKGNLWLSTINGVSYLNLETDRFSRYHEDDNPQSISNNTTNAVHCDSDGTVWVATEQGLNKLVNKEKGLFAHYGIEGSNHFQEVYRDKAGTLWAGTFGDGLYYMDTEKEQLVHSRIMELSEEIINTIYEDHSGYLWIGTENGLFQINPDRKAVSLFQNNADDSATLSNNTVNVVYEDRQLNLWVGTENGLNMYLPEKKEFVRFQANPKDDQSIRSNRIHSIYEDTHNTLWIGTWSKGINKFNYHQKGLKHYFKQSDEENSISDNNIWDFFEDEDNNIWIGTDNGLNRFNPETKQFDHFFHRQDDKSSLSSNRTYNIEQDRYGKLWISTPAGLNKFDPETGKTEVFSHDPDDVNSISYNTLWGLDIDSKGNIWIGTRGRGLNVLNPETEIFSHYNHDPDDPKSLSASFVSDVYIDSREQIWVGTRVGLNLFRPETETFKKFSYTTSENPHSLDGSIILDIQEDSKGRLWVGTLMGVNVIDIETHEILRFISRKDGLPDDIVWGITEDHTGTIYLGTTLGLAVLDSETGTFNIYDERDGIQGNEFNAGAAFTSSAGKVYMGGPNGFNSFLPSDLSGNPHAPPVVITDFQLFNKSVPILGHVKENDERTILEKSITYTDSLTLSHSDNVISFEFAALNFTIPEKNKYAYKLDGFDKNWNYIGDRNFVTYTELKAGEYTFQVKAANNDGVWNEEGTSLAILITPPYWQTTWFYLLSTLLIMGLAITLYRMRVRNIKEYSKRLEQEVSDRTSELNNKNRDLQKALKQLEEARDELVEKAHKAGMAELATGVLHNVGNILNSVNTSASLIGETVRQSRIEGLMEANVILRNHIDRIEEFITENPKGKKLMHYYLRLEKPLKTEHSTIINHSDRLIEKIELINEVIAAQQSYAGANMFADRASLTEMIDNALALQAGSIEKHGLTIEKDLQNVDPIVAQRTKLIHVLVNIFKNAKEAMAGNPPREKKISIKVWQDDDWVYLSVSDNGSGISRKQLDKIFTHGFTTKDSGHGFGLHSSANYMTEMGGKIEVSSDGKEKGATFTLMFPKQHPINSKSADNNGHGMQSMNK